MALKRGKFSIDEEKYMRDNLGKKPISDIAVHINRSEDAVTKWGLSKGLIAEKTDEDIGDFNRCIVALHDLPYWQKTIEGLTNDEIEYYENNWYKLYKQLNEDVSPTEHMYIRLLLLSEIDLNRIRIKDKQAIEAIDELKEQVRLEEKFGDDQDKMLIANYKAEISAMDAAMSSYITAKEKLTKEIKTYTQKVQADRHERRERVTSADTFWGYLQLLDDIKFQEEEAYRAEIGRIAMEKSEKELYELHEYMDKTVDHPILSAESLEYYDSLDKEGEEE